jgi:signal transduction histidine kinase
MLDKQPNILNRSGEMGRLIRQKDWSKTALGPIDKWPSILLNTVSLIIEIDFPIAICWGRELITIYNDAYHPLLGNKPEALGQPFLEIWPEAEKIIAPQINRALNGQPVYFENAEFTLMRNGKPEKAWFDYTFSPIRDAEDNIRGAIILVVEVTAKIRAQEELKQINETLEKRVKKRTAALEEYKNHLRILTYALNKAEEQERRRLARVLHDHLGQLLDLSVIKLDQLKNEVFRDNAQSKIAELKEIILMTNKYTRELVHELNPPHIFEEDNLVELLRWIAKRMKKYGLEITVKDDGEPASLNVEVHKILYESVRELFFNIVKHANVEKAKLTIRNLENQVEIIVEDAGKGFEMNGNKPIPTNRGGFGLFNVRERMDMLGGSLEIDSEPGKGTKAILYAPLNSNNGTAPPNVMGMLQKFINGAAEKESTSWAIDYKEPNIYDPNQLSLPLNRES